MSPTPGRINALGDLHPDEQEAWEERAALCEMDGGMPRQEAERIAWECVLIARRDRFETALHTGRVSAVDLCYEGR